MIIIVLLKNFIGEGKLGIKEIITNFGGLDITLRSSTLISKTILEVKKNENGNYNVEIIRIHKIFDEFKAPYNIYKGYPSKKETGNPYNMMSGYRNHTILKGEFKNKDEVMGVLKKRIEEAENKIRGFGENVEKSKNTK